MSHNKLFALLTALFLTTSAHANTITLNTISSDSVVGTFNTNFTTIANVINGNIEGSTDGTSVANVKADSIYEINMADDANPRVRDSELLSITVDTVSSQNTFVYSGLIPATDSDLTSDISAGVAYINGYRVSKGATSKTYTASRDTWVDLNQNGTYTFTEVANGAAEPVVAANSARVAKVVTDGTTVASVTDEANRRLPGLVVPANYRRDLILSRDSATVIRVGLGSCEVNNSMLTKTSETALTLTTAGDWAGGSSLAAANTMAFVGMDSSGNLKMHTTAPTHSNYAVSNTTGVKRYATWSSTVYRVLCWFYMNASSQVDTYGYGNFACDGVPNSIVRADTTSDTINDTTYQADLSGTTIDVYTTGGPLYCFNQSTSTAANWMNNSFTTTLSVDNVGNIAYERYNNGTGTVPGSLENENLVYTTQGTHRVVFKGAVSASDDLITRKLTIVEER